jgi:hypothetical protein
VRATDQSDVHAAAKATPRPVLLIPLPVHRTGMTTGTPGLRPGTGARDRDGAGALRGRAGMATGTGRDDVAQDRDGTESARRHAHPDPGRQTGARQPVGEPLAGRGLDREGQE